jgi:hypothetical protein
MTICGRICGLGWTIIATHSNVGINCWIRQANSPKDQPKKIFQEYLIGTMSELAGVFGCALKIAILVIKS